MNKLPKLTLIGAGPGDPELITYKAVKALQTADAVLYDALVHPDILRYAPASAKLVYVGKRPWQQGKGGCEFAQQDINHLIVQYAHSHGHVVRLKGGDPFVFGRGFEELYLPRIVVSKRPLCRVCRAAMPCPLWPVFR